MPVLTMMYPIITYFQQIIAWIYRYTAVSCKRLLARRQVMLRYYIECGDIVFPKSVTPSRVKENFDIFDFELSDGDVAEISTLNTD
jgi:diketogulonate reductase-like aldo/keto reductase